MIFFDVDKKIRKLERVLCWEWTAGSGGSYVESGGSFGIAYSGGFADDDNDDDDSSSSTTSTSSNSTSSTSSDDSSSGVSVGKIVTRGNEVFVEDDNGNILTVTTKKNLSGALQRLASEGIINKNYSEFWTDKGRVTVQNGKVDDNVMQYVSSSSSTSSSSSSTSTSSSTSIVSKTKTINHPSSIYNNNINNIPSIAVINPNVQKQLNKNVVNPKYYNPMPKINHPQSFAVAYYKDVVSTIDKLTAPLPKPVKEFTDAFAGDILGGLAALAGTGIDVSYHLMTAQPKKAAEDVLNLARGTVDYYKSGIDYGIDVLEGKKSITAGALGHFTAAILPFAEGKVKSVVKTAKDKFSSSKSYKVDKTSDKNVKKPLVVDVAKVDNEYKLPDLLPKPSTIDIIGDSYRHFYGKTESGATVEVQRFKDIEIRKKSTDRVKEVQKIDYSKGHVIGISDFGTHKTITKIDLSKPVPTVDVLKIDKTGVQRVVKTRDALKVAKMDKKGVISYETGREGFSKTIIPNPLNLDLEVKTPKISTPDILIEHPIERSHELEGFEPTKFKKSNMNEIKENKKQEIEKSEPAVPPIEILGSSGGKGRIFTVDDVLGKDRNKRNGGIAKENGKGTIQLQKTKTKEEVKLKEKQKSKSREKEKLKEEESEKEILKLDVLEKEKERARSKVKDLLKIKTIDVLKEKEKGKEKTGDKTKIKDILKLSDKEKEREKYREKEKEKIKPATKIRDILKYTPASLTRTAPSTKTREVFPTLPALDYKYMPRIQVTKSKTSSNGRPIRNKELHVLKKSAQKFSIVDITGFLESKKSKGGKKSKGFIF